MLCEEAFTALGSCKSSCSTARQYQPSLPCSCLRSQRGKTTVYFTCIKTLKHCNQISAESRCFKPTPKAMKTPGDKGASLQCHSCSLIRTKLKFSEWLRKLGLGKTEIYAAMLHTGRQGILQPVNMRNLFPRTRLYHAMLHDVLILLNSGIRLNTWKPKITNKPHVCVLRSRTRII